MVILIDTNVLLDFLLHRDANYLTAKRVVEYCMSNPGKGFVAFHSIPTLFYVLRKYAHVQKRRELLKDLCSVVTVAGAEHEAVLEAIDRADFQDFEDCLQMYCAKAIGADYIVTNNTKDYKNSDIPAITSQEAQSLMIGA